MGEIISGIFGNKAAKEQAAAARRGQDITKQMYDQSRADMLPWLEAGQRSLSDLERELGSSYQESEGYKFAVKEGEKGALSNLAALGMTNSGSALKALTEYRMGLASQDYGTWYNRKAGLAGAGQTQSTNLGSLGTRFGQNMANLYGQEGAAKASGKVAIGNALGNTVNDIFGFAGYKGGGGQGFGISPQNSMNYLSGAGGLY